MRFLITIVALALLVLLARKDGGMIEQRVAKTFATAFVFGASSRFLFLPDQTDFRYFNPLLFAIESGVLIVLMATSIKSNRSWPICASALQLIVVVGHLAMLMHVQGLPQVYWGMTTMPTYLEYLVLLGGIFVHARRRKRIGNYPDWRAD